MSSVHHTIKNKQAQKGSKTPQARTSGWGETILTAACIQYHFICRGEGDTETFLVHESVDKFYRYLDFYLA